MRYWLSYLCKGEPGLRRARPFFNRLAGCGAGIRNADSPDRGLGLVRLICTPL
jgi:hypothetical protein